MAKKLYLCGTAVSAVLLAASTPVWAQAQTAPADAGQPSAVEEVVVTASRREERLQTAPAAINVVAGKTMDVLQVQSVSDLTNLVPGLKIDGNTNDQLRLGLRGAFSSATTPGGAQAVGLYVDGVPFAHTTNLDNDLADITRVEVLRGPQGTLYGQNVIGGLINIITRDPSDQVVVNAKATYGSYNLIDLQGYVSGPLAPNLAGSLSFDTTHSDGWLRNLVTGNMLDQLDKNFFRGKLAWTPNEDLRVRFIQDLSTDNTYGIPREVVYGSTSRFVVPPRDETVLPKDGRYNSFAADSALLVDYNLGWAQFNSISSYQYNRPSSVDDSLVTDPVAIGTDSRKQSSDTFTQEFRLSGQVDKLQWQTGTFIYLDNTDFQQVYYVAAAPGTLGAVLAPTPETIDQDFRVLSQSYSVFGEATYNFTDVFSLTAGARYNWDHKQSNYHDYGSINATFDILGQAPFTVQQSGSWDELSPKVTARAKWSGVGPLNDLMFYVTVNKGYEAGDFQAGGTVAQSTGIIPPEIAINEEGGVKTTFWDHRATFDVTGFSTQYTDLQILSQTSSGTTTIASINASAWGIEASATLRPIQGLVLSADYAYLDTRVANGVMEDGYAVGGNALPQSPKNSYDLTASYTRNIASGYDLRFTGSYDYKGPVFFDVRNCNLSCAPAFLNETVQSNLDAEIAILHGHWQFSVWGKNLTNEISIVRANNEGNIFDETPAEHKAGDVILDGVLRDPRTIGVSVRWSY